MLCPGALHLILIYSKILAQHLNVERRLKPRVPLLPFKHRAVGSDIGDIKVESERSRVAAFSLDVSLI